MDEELLAGRYRRVRPLGSGGMGDVWLADDLELGRLVAVKRLRFGVPAGQDAELVERMLREARVVARLHHPAIVTLHDLVRVEGRPHLIMQYVDGESLADRIQRESVVEWRAVARIVADVAGGLAAAHRAGVLHRDVKPANVLIDTEGRGHLADFGIARGDDDAAITRAGEMVGTVAFMPPEVARDSTATAASDVWSLGATFFAAVEGRAPFAGAGASVPAILARLVSDPAPPTSRAGACTGLLTRMLASDPSRRPTAAQVADEVEALLTTPSQPVPPPAPVTTEALPPPPPSPYGRGDAPTQHGPPTPPPDGGSGRRGRRLAAVAAVLLLVGAVVGVVLLQDDGGDGDGPGEAGTSAAGTSAPGGPDAPRSRFAPVDVGAMPRRLELGVDDPSSALYVASLADDTVTVIDPGTGDHAEVEVCDGPRSLVVARDGSRAYAGCQDGRVAAVDASGEVVLWPVGGPDPRALRLTPDGTLLFVPTGGSEVAVVDTATGRVVGRPAFGTAPEQVHVVPDGSVAYAPDPGSGALMRIDVADGLSVSEVDLPGPARGMQVSEDGTRLYVSLDDDTRVAVVDRSPDAVATEWSFPAATDGLLRLQPGADRAWVPSPGDDAIWVFDPTSGEQVTTVALPGEPGTIVNFDSTGSTAYVPDFTHGTVLAVDTATFDVTTLEGTGPVPSNLTVSPDDETLYVVGRPDGPDGPGRVLALPLD